MSRRNRVLRKKGVKLELDYDGVGELLNSDAIVSAVEDKANDIASGMSGTGVREVTVEEPLNPARNNRARRYVSFYSDNPQDTNKAIRNVYRSRD